MSGTMGDLTSKRKDNINLKFILCKFIMNWSVDWFNRP
jgi:hypothetical protein